MLTSESAVSDSTHLSEAVSSRASSLDMPIVLSNVMIERELSFPAKIYRILESRMYEHIIRWTLQEDAFVVLDCALFTEMVLKVHFKHTRFESFARLLNAYGFHRKILHDHAAEGVEPNGKKKSRAGCLVHHVDFQRGHFDRVQSLRRKESAASSSKRRPLTVNTNLAGQISSPSEPMSALSVRSTGSGLSSPSLCKTFLDFPFGAPSPFPTTPTLHGRYNSSSSSMADFSPIEAYPSPALSFIGQAPPPPPPPPQPQADSQQDGRRSAVAQQVSRLESAYSHRVMSWPSGDWHLPEARQPTTPPPLPFPPQQQQEQQQQPLSPPSVSSCRSSQTTTSSSRRHTSLPMLESHEMDASLFQQWIQYDNNNTESQRQLSMMHQHQQALHSLGLGQEGYFDHPIPVPCMVPLGWQPSFQQNQTQAEHRRSLTESSSQANSEWLSEWLIPM